MKKLLVVAVFLLGLAFNVQARAYQTGDVLLGAAFVASPLELGTDWGEVNVDDQTDNISHDAKLGHPGLGGEISALYFVHPRVALGVLAEDQNFDTDLSSGWQINTSTRQRNYMLASRIFLTDTENLYKVYLPLAVGVARTDMTVDFTTNEHFRYTGFAGHAGLGVERALTDRWALDFEVRYNVNRFHASKQVSAGPHAGHHVTIYPRAAYVTTSLRVLYRI